MLRRITGTLLVLLFGSLCAFAQESKGKLEVVTTLFPTYDFAKQIGKDKINVSLLLPPGVESHTFEPKPQDVVRINKADVFIYTGKYMEPWAEDLLKGVFSKNLAVVDSSFGIELIAEDDHDGVDDYEDEHGHHHQGDNDPHMWVDLGNAQTMADTIAKSLADKDSDNREFYLKNAKEYKMKLADLDRRFKETLSTAKHKTIIYGGHFVFGYFAKRYGLEHDSPYDGFSPNAEPSPKAIASLIEKLKQSGIKYIYYEELLDPKVARTISQETGVKLELLHGAHNVSKDELTSGVTFLDIMEDNLKKLRVGLECQ